MQAGYWTVMCIVLWILKPYPVTPCSPLHKAGSTDGKLEGNYCTTCCALYVQSQKATQAHECTELGSPGRKDGKKRKKISQEPPPFCRRQLVSLSSLWATGLLNYLQCSASLFRLAQSQVCFSAELLKPTASAEPWPLIPELLSTVLVLSKTTLVTMSQRLVLLSLSIQGLENAMWSEWLFMHVPPQTQEQLGRHSLLQLRLPAWPDHSSGIQKHVALQQLHRSRKWRLGLHKLGCADKSPWSQ